MKYILGYNVPRKDTVHEQLHSLLAAADGFKWQEWVMGTLVLSMLLVLKFLGKRHKKLRWLRTLGPMTACVIGIVAVAAGKIDKAGIKIVKNIPKARAVAVARGGAAPQRCPAMVVWGPGGLDWGARASRRLPRRARARGRPSPRVRLRTAPFPTPPNLARPSSNPSRTPKRKT